ncbi:hypothetical protein FPV67DRAFT_278112 [Lyophyllum atratum]|nr:hypothetical protein FPV67DRAFT_278112 [Lyophyllum atratum]
MVENDLKLVFEKDATTIFFPKSSPELRDSSLSATVHRRLSFLHCDFVLPPEPNSDDVASLAFPAVEPTFAPTTFPRVKVTPELWHRRLGHLGRDATRAVLTKNYATGVVYDGPFTDSHCIPCILGKQPSRPYDHFGVVRRRSATYSTWIHAALSRRVSPMATRPISTPSLMITPTSAAQLYWRRKIRPHSIT